MAVRSIAQLKAWFKKGAYPKADQFWDWMESYWHKDEKLPISSVDELPERLNSKYDAALGQELEGKVAQTQQDLSEHITLADSEFTNLYNNQTEMENDIEAIQADISHINETIVIIESDIDEVEENVETNKNEIKRVDAEAELTRSQIVVLQDDLVIIAGGLSTAEENIAENTRQIAVVKGAWSYITAYDFGTATPTQQQLTDYANSKGIPPKEGLTVINKFDECSWRYDGVNLNEWQDQGIETVTQATNTHSGIVKGSTDTYKVSVGADGSMTVNGMQQLAEKVDAETEYLENTLNGIW